MTKVIIEDSGRKEKKKDINVVFYFCVFWRKKQNATLPPGTEF